MILTCAIVSTIAASALSGCTTVTTTDPVTGKVTTSKVLDKAAIESAVVFGRSLYDAWQGKNSGDKNKEATTAENLSNDTAAFEAIVKSMPSDDPIRLQLEKLYKDFKAATADGKIDKKDVLMFIDDLQPIVDGMKDSTTKTRLQELLAEIRKQIA